MRPIRTWHRASLIVALSLVTATAAFSVSAGKTDQQEHSSPGIVQGQLGPAISLDEPSHENWLGLIVKDTDEATAKRLKLPHVTGVLVVSVVPGSPAEKAGFKPNDVILQFDGQRVRSVAQLHRLIRETPANHTVKVEISRGGKLQALQAKIGVRGPNALLEKPRYPNFRVWQWPGYKIPLRPRPEPFIEPVPKGKIIPLPPVMPKFYLGPLPNLKPQPLYPQAPFIGPGPEGQARPFLNPPAKEHTLGISGQNLTPQLASFFGVKEGRGVLITQVEKGSPASAAGLKAGDVIISMGSQQVSSMAELQWLLQTQPNRQRRVTLGIVRNRQERQMSVLLGPERPTPNQHQARPLPIMSMRLK